MAEFVNITEAEWEVMVVVWEHAPVAAATIVEKVEEKKHWTLGTVRTLLRRLVDKGALKQQPEGKRYLYSPLISKEECVKQASDSFLDRVLGLAPSATLIHLVEKSQLTKQEIQELRRILRKKEKSP